MPPNADHSTSRSSRENQLLLDLITAMHKAGSREQILTVALDLICRFGRWNIGEAWMLDANSATMSCMAAVHGDKRDRGALDDRTANEAVSLGRMIPQRAITSRQTNWLSGLDLPTLSPRRRFQTVLTIPVFDDDLRAALVFGKFRTQAEDRHFIKLMTVLGRQIDTALTLKQGEQKRQIAEARLASIVDLAADAIISMNAHRRIILFNPGAEQIFGYTAAEMIGQTLDVIVPERLLRHHGQSFSQHEIDINADSNIRKIETMGQRKNGEEFPVEMAYSRQTVQGETIYTAVVHDITRRRDDARRLEVYNELLTNAHDAIGLTDLNACFTYVNPAFAHMTGYSETEMTGMPVMALLDSSTSINDILTQMLTNDAWHSEIPLVRKDGSIFYGNINAFTIKNHQGEITGLGGIVRDVTETKLATEQIRRNETLYRALIRQIPNFAVLVFDQDLRFVLAEGEALERQGYQTEALEGRTLGEVLPPELSEPLAPFYRMTLEGQSMQIDFDLNGYTYDVRFVPLFADDGTIRNGMVVTNDITEAKRTEMEIRSLNQNLERHVVQRTADLEATNKELEAFTYSVSHDLRAPLRSINGFTKFLAEEYAHLLPEEGREYLNIVRETAREMGDLISALLSLSRMARRELTTASVDMKELVYEVLDELEPEMQGRSIEIAVGKLPRCYADRTLIKQVLTNLLNNAIKYSRIRPVAHIEVGSQWQDGKRVYYVKDNGTGFDMRMAHKLFGVFQRLHRAEDYEGSGVGLAIVQRIINRHGGQVWTQADVDKGATFYFTIGPGDKDNLPLG